MITQSTLQPRLRPEHACMREAQMAVYSSSRPCALAAVPAHSAFERRQRGVVCSTLIAGPHMGGSAQRYRVPPDYEAMEAPDQRHRHPPQVWVLLHALEAVVGGSSIAIAIATAMCVLCFAAPCHVTPPCRVTPP